MTSRRDQPAAYSSKSSTSASRSGISAAWTTIAKRLPRTSTTSWRFRPWIFFPTIEAPLAAGARGLHRLAVDDGQDRLRVPAGLHPVLLHQIAVNPGEGSIPGPLVEVVADTAVIGELMGQQPPGTTGSIHVAQGVEHFPQVQSGRSPGPGAQPSPGLDHGPLLVRQV